MRYTVRPISDVTGFSGPTKSNRFRSTWQQTLDLLSTELEHLDARDVVIEVDIDDESQIRNDGMLRAQAKVNSGKVRLAFDSKHGPLTYATDRFYGAYYGDPPDWQINMRAIALGLQALRRIEDYGIVKRDEQYAGFKALPAGRAMPASHMTTEQAFRMLHDVTGDPLATLRSGPRAAIRKARGIAHPDRNDGDRTLWDQVEQAAAVLGVAP